MPEILPKKSDRRIVSPTGIGTRKRVPKKPRANAEEQESTQQPEMRQRPESTNTPTSPLRSRQKRKSGGARIARRMAGAIAFIGMLLSGGGDGASASVMEVTKRLF